MREMKDSGVEWIGEIPIDWQIEKIKYNCILDGRTLDDKTDPDFEFEYIDISAVNSVGEISSSNIKFENSPSRARMIVCKNDVIVSTVRTYLRSIAFVDESDKYIASTGFAVLSPCEELVPKYFMYFTRSEYFISEVVSRSVGVSYPAINGSELITIYMTKPGITEQGLIAKYLDKKCGEINENIRDVEISINKLQEYKKSVITEAVTKGLDKSAIMKPSGIEWIGEIPINIELCKIKYIAEISSGEYISNSELNVEGDYPVFGGGKQLGNSDNYNVNESNILIGRVGANCGCVNNLISKAWATDNSLIVNIKEGDKNYIYYVLVSLNLNRLNESNAQPLITGFKVNNCSFPLFSLDEQEKIAKYLDGKCTGIDSVIADKKLLLEKLKHYKNSLIYEYVTGKKEVI